METYAPGSSITLNASPTKDVYLFEGWYNNDTLLSNDAEYTFTINKGMVITAIFNINSNGYSDGDGTIDNPYQIEIYEQLIYLANHSEDWTSNFVLIDDIHCSTSPEMTPIGNNSSNFQGNFDGQNHTIYDLAINYISGSYSTGTGLFGYSSYNEIRNLSIKNGSIKGHKEVGGIIGSAKNTDLINCSYTGSVESVNEDFYIGAYVGGLMGACHSSYQDVTVSDCYFYGSLKGNALGGIVSQVSKYPPPAYSSHQFVFSNLVVDFEKEFIDGDNYGWIVCGTNAGPVLYNCYANVKSSDTSSTTEGEILLSDEAFAQQASFSSLNFDSIWHWGIIADISSNAKPFFSTDFDHYLVSIENDSTQGSITGAGKYYTNDEVTLVATPHAGYTFVAWYNGENIVSNENPYIFNMTDEHVNLEAKFDQAVSNEDLQAKHAITLAPNPIDDNTLHIYNLPDDELIHFEIIALTGIMQHSEYASVTNGEHTIICDKIPKGAYVLIVTYGNHRYSESFLK